MVETGVPEPIRLTVKKRFSTMPYDKVKDMVVKVVEMAHALAPYLYDGNVSATLRASELVPAGDRSTTQGSGSDATGTP